MKNVAREELDKLKLTPTAIDPDARTIVQSVCGTLSHTGCHTGWIKFCSDLATTSRLPQEEKTRDDHLAMLKAGEAVLSIELSLITWPL